MGFVERKRPTAQARTRFLTMLTSAALIRLLGRPVLVLPYIRYLGSCQPSGGHAARYLPRTARLHAQNSRFDKLHACDVVPCAKHGQVQGKRNTYPHHQASPPRWRAPLHYRLCFLPVRRTVQNAEHCCPCFHSAPLADMALRRAGCAARKVTGAERTSEAPSAAGATCSGPGNAGRVREERVDRTKPLTATIFMRCGCSWAAKGMCWLVSAMRSMEVCSTAEQHLRK
jgi:hypothetical protein